MRITRQSFAAIGALTVGAFGLPALAEETVQLDTVSVQAEADRTPPTAEATDRKTLDERQIQSLDDFSRRVDPSVSIDGDSESFNIRGLGEDRVVTTLDGIRLPYLTYGARDGGGPVNSRSGGVDTFDFDGLSALDVYKGADSTLFGSGALGGVIALRSLTPEDLLTDGRTLGGLAKGSYSSADESWRSNLALAGRYMDTWFLVQGGYGQGHETESQGDVDSYGTTRSKANPADYDRYNALVTIHQYVDGGHRFGLTGEIFNREEDIDARTSSGVAAYAPGDYRQTEESERNRVSFDYKFTAPSRGGFIDEAEVIAYWQRVKLTSIRDATRRTSPIGVYDQTNDIEIEAFGLNAQAVSRYRLAGIGNTLRYGAEAITDETKQFSASVNNCPAVPIPFSTCYFLHDNQADAPDSKGRSLGLFAENEIGFLDGMLAVTPGIRFDWYEQEPEDNAAYRNNDNYKGPLADNSDSKLSPKLLIEWHAASDLTLFAQWAQAFKAPNPSQLYLTFGSVGSYAIIGNPDLKPETSNGFELGARAGDDLLGGKVTVFNNYYRNFIDQITTADAQYPVGGITQYVNRSKVQIYGVEVSGQWSFAPGWKTWGSVAVQTGKDTSLDVHLNSVPPLKAILGLGYDTEVWGAAASATLAASRDEVESPATQGHLQRPGYEVFDLTGWWSPSFAPGIKIEAGVYNLFDETYWNAIDIPDSITLPVDYYTEPGRNFRVSASYRF